MQYLIIFMLTLSMAFGTAAQEDPLVSSFFDDLSLVASLTTSSEFSGGIRYSPSKIEVIDFGVTYDSSSDDSEAGYWIDYYYDHFGILISAPANEDTIYSFMFAAEGKVSDQVSVGIGFKIVEIQPDVQPTYVSGWDAYLVIPI